ncbi:MAG: hypothetical protein ACI8V2_003139 [Candidatus Latescibacterota bacterium]|jgi:hypothetical protein
MHIIVIFLNGLSNPAHNRGLGPIINAAQNNPFKSLIHLIKKAVIINGLLAFGAYTEHLT